jgi:diadenosine tetraphosphate (Ap4A) HIT family hydrolase
MVGMERGYVKGCEHCPSGIGLRYPLFENDKFWVVCDVHPLIKGHILIVTKRHLSCMAALSDEDFSEYEKIYQRVKEFLKANYGEVAVFEHGISGQTVAHAHTHFFPFSKDTVIKDKNSLREIDDVKSVRSEFKNKGKYIYLEHNGKKWLVDTSISYPGFFREIFAELLGVKERSDWKSAHENEELMQAFKKEIEELARKWNDMKIM